MALNIRGVTRLAQRWPKVKVQHSSWRAASSQNLEQALGLRAATKLSTLDNGLRVATEDTSSPFASVGLFMDVGSRHETATNNGATNFLLKMLFGGNSKMSKDDLAAEIAKNGYTVTPVVGREQSGLIFKCLNKDVSKVVQTIADMVQTPLLDSGYMEEVRKAIQKEMGSSDFKSACLNSLHECAFQGTALAQPVLGTNQSVASLGKAELETFKALNMLPSRFVLAAAGGVNHDEVAKVASKAFTGSNISKDATDIPARPAYCRYTSSGMYARDDNYDDTWSAIAVRAPPLTSITESLALSIAASYLGRWDPSTGGGIYSGYKINKYCNMAPECKEHETFNLPLSDTGLFGAYMQVNRNKVGQFPLEVVLNTWINMTVNAVDEGVVRAKNALTTGMFSNKDETATCQTIGQHILTHGRRIPDSEMYSYVKAIGTNQFKDICYDYLFKAEHVAVSYGATEAFPEPFEIDSHLKLNRY